MPTFALQNEVSFEFDFDGEKNAQDNASNLKANHDQSTNCLPGLKQGLPATGFSFASHSISSLMCRACDGTSGSAV